MSAALKPVLRQAGRDLAYLAAGLVTAVLGFVVWVTGVTVSLSLAVLILGFPAMIASAWAFRQVCEIDRRNAQRLLGRPVRGAYARPPRGAGLPAHVRATLGDVQTWRDLAWLVTHSVLGFTAGVVALTAVVYAVGVLVAPAWYWAPADGLDWGFWTIDSLGEALAVVPLALPLGALAVGLLRLMAAGDARLAAALLGDARRPSATRPPASAGTPAGLRGDALAAHLAVAALVGLTCTLIWGLTGGNYFWPIWVWLGLGLSVALHRHAVLLARVGGDQEAGLRAHAELSLIVGAACVAIWALAGGGYFWPVWPALGMGVAVAIRALIVHRRRLPWVRERRLVERVDELTRTRRGALDVQAAELRRIERDLHDGAQARLVALSMQLGRAEERLAGQPEIAGLVRQARGEASAAIAELRDLARGIAPPVLADRGLAAAVDALARRAAAPVTLEAAIPRRLPPAVETAAYFVAAEAITNASKHARAAAVRVRLTVVDDALRVTVADDGRGGADPAGSGLQGLRQRCAALDGELTVTSPPGGGTTIEAKLPCGS